MKRFLPLLRNKMFIAFAVFLIYTAFLDEYDVFTIIAQKRKMHQLEKAKKEMLVQLNETQSILKRLKYSSEVERYAREKKFFKKDDEDVFVIFQE